MNERPLHFANNAVTVRWEGARAQRVVEHLFARVKAQGRGEATVSLSLVERAQDLVVTENGRELLHTESDGHAAECLLGQAVYHLVDRSSGGLVLHAAAVALDERRVLVMPGTSGAGKTTLTAWLVKHGHDYLTDEAVFLPLESTSLESLCRPLNLKRGSRAQLQALSPAADGVLSFEGGDLVDPAALGCINPRTQGELFLFVFPTFEQGKPLELSPLSPAQAAQALLTFAANARSVPRHGLGEVARLAKAARAFSLRYGDSQDLPTLARWLHEQS